MTWKTGEIYMGTILLEQNRWTADKEPSYRVSDWLPRWRRDGFDGVELWENHAARCEEQELARLERSELPIAVYNSYISFADGAEEQRAEAARLIRRLGARAVKFNFGREPEKLQTYIRNWNEWTRLLPADCRLLCECHPGTVMEEPQAAAAALLAMDRCEAIVHPFHSLGPLADWFRRLGSSITHAHVQYRLSGQTFQRLNRNPAHIAGILKEMREAGFRGSFTLEFAEGTGQGEQREQLYEAALDDLSLLRQQLEP
ncbi:sugar phosphate isomerase/epimerase [Paenibacillus doosanensis]|uniref:sugar phosphate isomerase/epimerase family protein n=1 Tax=Paenibacillus doosanensis TaxID=1229154 RepID=UPI0021802562|nr:sugar phosphate isomerase/epimerase [Paenibacillus doosanensis]MCS7462197.1 sugar phosphate isomerase/epimerase [Paenibacillus doosanensis]